MSDSNVLPFFKIAGMHSSLKSMDYCFKRTSFWKLKCRWKYKVIKIIVCTFLCVTERPRVNFSVFRCCQVCCESHFFFVTSSSSAHPWEAQVWWVWPSRSPLTSHRSTTLPPVTLLGAPRRDSHVCQVTQCHLCEQGPVLTSFTGWHPALPPLVGLLAGSKEDWESPPEISRVIFGMELFGQP